MNAEREAGVPDTADWYTIDGIEALRPFLVSVVSDQDHWLFAASNGGLTAGRGTPDLSLFPYYTQDKLIDLAGTTGPLTVIWAKPDGGGATLWRPLAQDQRGFPRRLAKKLDGTQLRFEETHPDLGLRFSYTWGFSQRFGFVRHCVLENLGEGDTAIDILDGLQNLHAPGLSDSFQNQFSILVDAYKRVECDPDTGLRLVYLSSIPTDRAEPSESLRCNVAWSSGMEGGRPLVTTRQLSAFYAGILPAAENEARGERAACLDTARFTLPAGQRRCWYTVADVGLSTARATDLRQFLRDHDATARSSLLQAELDQTSHNLRRMVGSADGLQCTRDGLRQSRHYSNVMFNIMRGGVFIDGDNIPRDAFITHVQHFNRPVAQRHAAWLAGLPQQLTRQALDAAVATRGDAELQRLSTAFLPLTFSRRHGDPSRPWNRFSIQVRDPHGRPRLGFQGNWRDIFQNWEALLHAFPSHAEGVITRFLDASTADGYNPYKLTDQGFDWERVDPDQPWSNIGYWGDHQIIYLLRLLELSRRFHPAALDGLLEQKVFAYARVPYRIAPYSQLIANPRVSISYDDAAEEEIDRRVQEVGADGQLLAAPDGSVLQVSLFEKLLVPLLAKLANYVPEGGIWMNTQRPEWNDANNALVGYGISVVTMAYCHRYVAFLLSWWGTQPDGRELSLSRELATLLRAQAQVFTASTATRRGVMDSLGQSVSTFRQGLYTDGLSGDLDSVTMGEIKSFLGAVRSHLAGSLRNNRRPDGLFHSYNLLRVDAEGAVQVANLYEMLEGQVAMLSARLLSPSEALDLTRALRGSALYRPDQDSYLLYPDRDLPRFLDKNRIAEAEVARSALLGALAEDPDQTIVEQDCTGSLRFAGHLRNAVDLQQALAALPARWAPLVEGDGAALVAHFEDIFDHHAFTGRSGTFFAYEGLGSIYWHMVSKLVLAIQENVLAIGDDPAQARARDALARAYEAAQAGLGLEKTAAHYGAFPTDAYSHTPKHAGAQQPGMTGQVKEDILIRLGELGIQVQDGRLSFRPSLLRAKELLTTGGSFTFFDLDGQTRTIQVPPGAIALTFCQVPIIYRAGSTASIVARLAGGGQLSIDGTALSAELSGEIFRRTNQVRCLEVELPGAWLRQEQI